MLIEITEEIESSRVDGVSTNEKLENTILWRAWDKISSYTKDVKKSELKKLVLGKRTITIEVPDTNEDSNSKQIKDLESLEEDL